MVSVKLAVFIDTLINEDASHYIDEVDGVVNHIVAYNGKTVIIPLINDEDILGDEVAIYLSELGMLDLLPALVPDHPAAEFAKKLIRN